MGWMQYYAGHKFVPWNSLAAFTRLSQSRVVSESGRGNAWGERLSVLADIPGCLDSPGRRGVGGGVGGKVGRWGHLVVARANTC